MCKISEFKERDGRGAPSNLSRQGLIIRIFFNNI